jgi:hypothetical protein
MMRRPNLMWRAQGDGARIAKHEAMTGLPHTTNYRNAFIC